MRLTPCGFGQWKLKWVISTGPHAHQQPYVRPSLQKKMFWGGVVRKCHGKFEAWPFPGVMHTCRHTQKREKGRGRGERKERNNQVFLLEHGLQDSFCFNSLLTWLTGQDSPCSLLARDSNSSLYILFSHSLKREFCNIPASLRTCHTLPLCLFCFVSHFTFLIASLCVPSWPWIYYVPRADPELSSCLSIVGL